MNDITPYKIRYDLLEMAKDILMQEWQSQREVVNRSWEQQIGYQRRIGGHEIIDAPEMPELPSIEKIIDLATQLNEFVSNSKNKK